MKLEHIALSAHTEAEADKFFIELPGMERKRSFTVAKELMEKFFGISQESQFLRYTNGNLDIEVMLSEDGVLAQDKFTHTCLLVEDIEELFTRAQQLGLTTNKVPRKETGFYYFLRDYYGNLYEIKEIKKNT